MARARCTGARPRRWFSHFRFLRRAKRRARLLRYPPERGELPVGDPQALANLDEFDLQLPCLLVADLVA